MYASGDLYSIFNQHTAQETVILHKFPWPVYAHKALLQAFVSLFLSHKNILKYFIFICACVWMWTHAHRG